MMGLGGAALSVLQDVLLCNACPDSLSPPQETKQRPHCFSRLWGLELLFVGHITVLRLSSRVILYYCQAVCYTSQPQERLG